MDSDPGFAQLISIEHDESQRWGGHKFYTLTSDASVCPFVFGRFQKVDRMWDLKRGFECTTHYSSHTWVDEVDQNWYCR